MRITAALLEKPSAPFRITDLELSGPGPDEVLVRVTAVGICGTDLEFAHFFATPAVLGHEGSGVVEAVGGRVTGLEPGDPVAMSFTSCGTCRTCRHGAPAYCAAFDALNFSGRRPDGTTALTLGGQDVNAHFLGQSSFASHVVAPARAVVKLPRTTTGSDLARVGPFGCGFQTGAGGVLNVLKPPVGSTIAVFGAGAVGTAAVIAASLSGCSSIVAVDLDERRLAAARAAGATDTINSGTVDAAGALRDIVPDGLDFVIDTTGHEQVLRTAVEALGPLGRAGVIGIGPSESMSFGWRSVLNGRSVTGIIAGGAVPQTFVPRLLDLHAAGRFPVDPLISYFPFGRIGEAMAAVRAGEVTKAVLTMD